LTVNLSFASYATLTIAGEFGEPNTVEDRTVQPLATGSVRPGARLNGVYEIEKLIAQGGMGEVYRGFSIQTRHRVAIKMIRPEYTNDPDIFNLLRREALILRDLTHEAIVRYFVFSIDPDLRRAYLAMEFVDGPTLKKRLASGALPLEDVKILQRRLTGALQSAHEHGIVHRDVSPDNIILPDNDVRKAKIVDFGIARLLNPTEVSIIAGRFAGKFNFASPEQFGLAGGEVTFKSDIYSLGLVLAAALRGRPIDMGGTLAEALAKRSAPPDLSDIHPAIRPIIQAMLQPIPANRPASMEAVGSWQGSPDPGLPPSAGAKPSPAPERKGGRIAAALGALLVIVGLGSAAYAFRDELARWSHSATAPVTPPSPARLPPISGSEARIGLPPLGPPPKSTEEPSAQTPAPAPSVEAPPRSPSSSTAAAPPAPSPLSAPLPTASPAPPAASPAPPAASQTPTDSLQGQTLVTDCASQQAALDRLRADPTAERVRQFWRELQCERLRPQVRLLMESLNISPEPTAGPLAPSPAETPAPQLPSAASPPIRETDISIPPADASVEADACRRELAELNSIRSKPNLAEARQFVKTLTCDALKPQAERLLDSLTE
jgi:serine/threonine-protein kinase